MQPFSYGTAPQEVETALFEPDHLELAGPNTWPQNQLSPLLELNVLGQRHPDPDFHLPAVSICEDLAIVQSTSQKWKSPI